MATYNGQSFVLEQLQSILAQLGPEDEVIVVDDCSTDNTVMIIEGIGDPRIAVHRNDVNVREVKTFGRAIAMSTGDVVFLADQDDIWRPGRVQRMLGALERSGALVLTSNSDFIDADGKPLAYELRGVTGAQSGTHLRNVVGVFAGEASYFGCAMAFRKELKPLILPIPDFVESHDLWIAFAGNLARSNCHLDDITFDRRIHANNASTKQRVLYKKLVSRAIFALSVAVLSARLLVKRRD
ncbi:MAG: glycosyltransferase [Pseudomonadota bacterium]